MIEHSDHINRYIIGNSNRVKPFPTANMERLDDENYIVRPLTLEEIKLYVRKTKEKAPRSTKINKQILEKCTNKTLEQLTNIFSACLSAGYFPNVFKNAIIKFIP